MVSNGPIVLIDRLYVSWATLSNDTPLFYKPMSYIVLHSSVCIVSMPIELKCVGSYASFDLPSGVSVASFGCVEWLREYPDLWG